MPQTEPLRLRILDALAVVLAGITVAGGYRHDLNAMQTIAKGTQDERLAHKHVFVGRALFGDDDPDLAITILEVPIPIDQAAVPPDSPYSKGEWALLVQGFVPDDLHRPTRPAHVLMADVKKRLAIEKLRNADFELFGMGDHVINMRVGPGVVRPPDEISARAYFWLDVSLQIVEDLSNPYED